MKRHTDAVSGRLVHALRAPCGVPLSLSHHDLLLWLVRSLIESLQRERHCENDDSKPDVADSVGHGNSLPEEWSFRRIRA